MIDLDEIAATLGCLPGVLGALLAPYDDATLSARPAPEEWSAKEVIGHLITCDRGAFRDRIEAIIGGATEVPRFDAGAGLSQRDPMSSSIDELLADLTAVRVDSVAFVRALRLDDVTATAPYGDVGTFAAADFLLEWPYHDQDHIRQILAAVQRHYLPHMTDTMRRALVGT